MSDDLTVIQQTLGLDEDDALFVLELCDMLEREDAIAAHGYPKDTPMGRDLAARLEDTNYRRRLRELAQTDGASPRLLEALA